LIGEFGGIDPVGELLCNNNQMDKFFDLTIFQTPIVGMSITLVQLLVFVSAIIWVLFITRLLHRSGRRILTRFHVEGRMLHLILLSSSATIVGIGLILSLSVLDVAAPLLVKQILYFSIPIGQTELSLVKILWSLVVMLVASIGSKYLRTILRNQLLPPFDLPRNAEFLLLRFVHVCIFGLGILIALNAAGLSLTNFTTILGGLSIGIGFGLQNIASNLISGLILIFERPVRIGDTITVGDTFGMVNAINLRSTHITTNDNIDIIVPNSQLVSEPITNWTHRDEQVRIKVEVGVAYGSDTTQVKNALTEVAKEHPRTINQPEPHLSPLVKAPEIHFIRFGDSSLDFLLYVWIYDARERYPILSDLHFMIDQKFRTRNIEIPFPQREVRLVSPNAVKDSIAN